MSKSTANTRGKILDRALEMFNERGIEYVGLRELAADLDMRVGNITYYFPTKDDLVYEISIELSKSNSQIATSGGVLTMEVFLETLRKMYLNQIRFKCLLLSFVHLMKQNKKIAAAYKKTQKARRSTIKTNLETLSSSGYFKELNEIEMDLLVSTLSLISRFWISEAAISFRKESEEQLVKYYLKIVAQLLHPYATNKGVKEIKPFINS